MIIDTHCHLDFPQFEPDREAVIQRAKKSGVKFFINVGSSLENSKKSVSLAAAHDNIFASVGIHPHDAGNAPESAFREIEHLAGNKKVVAIGEVGLDYFKSPVPPDKQKEAFKRFLELSERLGLPLIIHNREAHNDVLDILKRTRDPIRGVMHCFSGDKVLLDEVLRLGLHVSFTCNLTFKNAKGLRELAKSVPRDRLLLETDAPFLAPESLRGKRNEPAYITELRDTLAVLLDLPKDEIERITTDNAKKLFGLPI